MPTDSLISMNTSTDFSKACDEKSKITPHSSPLNHNEEHKHAYRESSKNAYHQFDHDGHGISDKDIKSRVRAVYHAQTEPVYGINLRTIDALIRATEIILCLGFWLLLAAISGIDQVTYLCFSVYHIVYFLLYHTPHVEELCLKTVARFTLLFIGCFFLAMWVGFLAKVAYTGQTFDRDANILVELHKQCKCPELFLPFRVFLRIRRIKFKHRRILNLEN